AGAGSCPSPTSSGSSDAGQIGVAVGVTHLGVSVRVGPPHTVATHSAEETRGLAAGLAAVAEAGDVIALFGGLGAGKTEFAKGFARGLGVAGTVNSPTFVLMAEYPGRLPLF